MGVIARPEGPKQSPRRMGAGAARPASREIATSGFALLVMTPPLEWQHMFAQRADLGRAA
jgi:hypothetical protein